MMMMTWRDFWAFVVVRDRVKRVLMERNVSSGLCTCMDESKELPLLEYLKGAVL